MNKTLDADWIGWIQTNIQRGCDQDGIFKTLLDEGYAWQDIQICMGYTPNVPLDQLVNPLGREPKPTAELTQCLPEVVVDRDQFWIPNGRRMDCPTLEIYTLADVLSAAECLALQAQFDPVVVGPAEGHAPTVQASLDALQLRLCKLVGIHPAYAETLTCQHFEVGEGVPAHTDAFGPQDFGHPGARMGQRTHTLLLYLNAAESGGETCFELAGLRITPRQGSVLVWRNLLPDGSVNPNSARCEAPLDSGKKTLLTLHLRASSRQRPAPGRYPRELNEWVPNYTWTGFEKRQLDPNLFAEIAEFYRANLSASSDEFVDGGFIHDADSLSAARSSTLVELSATLREQIHASLKPLLEQWCGQSLAPTYDYGIRTYHHNAVLEMHRDRLDTHIISAIINVAQQLNRDWPLRIEDNSYRQHQLLLKPGDMVFYEGGRLLHGRPEPLDGQAYANIFCHFKPVTYQAPAWRETLKTTATNGSPA